MLNNLKPPKSASKKRKRVGRGTGSGHGKTSCKGHKGQNARAGGGVPPWFEGGQMPLQRRLPKRGFTNIFRQEYCVMNVKDLAKFAGKTDLITPEYLVEQGHIKKLNAGLKILGSGEITVPIHIRAHKISRSAIKKIEDAGGAVEVIKK